MTDAHIIDARESGGYEMKYVLEFEVADYEALGWRIVSDMKDTHHGHHAVLMRRDDD